ncbi:hypothetical protein PV326_001356, partial [Microctonus aethiopoides]
MIHICPRCACSVSSQSLLWVHFKFEHSVTRNEPAYCRQSGCTRIYKNIYDHKKHIQISHSQNFDTVQHANCEVKIDNINDKGNTMNVSFDNVLDVASSSNTNTDRIENLTELQNMVTNGALSFIAKLYSNNNVTRSVIQDIIDNMNEFFGSDCAKMLKKVHANGSGEENNKLFNSAIDSFFNPFKGSETEYKRQQYFEKSGSHKGVKKIGAIYGKILGVPPEFNS